MSNTYVMIFIKDIYPYYREINNILAYPNGFIFRVRYRQEWVKLRNEKMFKGNDGLILLHATDSSRVIPLRKVTISEVVKIGTLVFVSVMLGDIIEFSSNPEKRLEQLDQFQHDLAKVTTRTGGVIPVVGTVNITTGLVDKEFIGDEHERVLNNWGNLIEILGQLPNYHDFDFIKFVNLTNETGKPIKPQENPSGLEYPLLPSKGYLLSVLQVVPRSGIVSTRDKDGKIFYPERENKWIEIQTPSQDINLFTNRLPIAGRYEIYTFRFNVNEIMNEKISVIGISVSKKTDSANQTEYELVLPVRLHLNTGWHVWRVLNLLVFIIGGLVLLVPDLFQAYFPSLPFTLASGEMTTIQKSAIVLLVLTSWSFPKAEKWLNKLMGV